MVRGIGIFFLAAFFLSSCAVPAAAPPSARGPGESPPPAEVAMEPQGDVPPEAYAYFGEAVSYDEESRWLLVQSWREQESLEAEGLEEVKKRSGELWQEAVKCYEKVLELAPFSSIVHRKLALGYLQRRELVKGLTHLEKAAALDKEDFTTHYLLGDLYEKNERTEDAIQEFELALGSPEAMEDKVTELPLLFVRLAGLYERVGKPSRAVEIYDRLLDMLENPPASLLHAGVISDLIRNPAPVLEGIGELYLQAKKYPEAVEAFKKARAYDPARTGVRQALVRALMEAGDTDAAVAECKAALEENPKEIGFHMLLYQCYEKRGEIPRAIEECRSYIEAGVDSPELKFLLAGLYEKEKKGEEAQEIYEGLIREPSKYPPAYFALVRIHRERGELGRALEVLGEALDGGLESPVVFQAVDNILGEEKDRSKRLLALEFLKARWPEDQMSFARYLLLGRTAMSLAEEPNGGTRQPGASGQGLTSEEEEYGRLALSHLDKALALRKDAILVYLYESSLYWLLGDKEKSLERIEVAIALRPLAFLQRRKAAILLEMKRHEKALETLLSARDAPGVTREEYLDIRYDLALVYEKLKEPEKAMQELKEILLISPDNAPANNALGYFYAERGENLEEAANLIQKALLAEPESGAYLDSLGWVYFKQGRLNEALGKLKEATARMEDPVILEHLGDAFWELGEPDLAREAWERGSTLDVESGSLKERLGRFGAKKEDPGQKR